MKERSNLKNNGTDNDIRLVDVGKSNSAAEIEKGGENEISLKKRVLKKEDGRYIIFFDK